MQDFTPAFDMNCLHGNIRRFALKWLASFLVVLGTQSTWADDELQLALPGQPLSQTGQYGDEEKRALSGWYALSLKEGALIVEQAGTKVPSDFLHATGKRADQLLSGKPLRRPPKPNGFSVKTPANALVLMRIEKNIGGLRKLIPGQFPGSIAPDILREGWTATGEVAGRKWNFSVTHKKRPDGKLLAGSLEVIADPDFPNETRKVLLPPASGMAFTKQELLWLGDMNGDGEPDLLLRRAWVTGEVDFVLVVSREQPPRVNGVNWLTGEVDIVPVVSPMLATAYFNPDRPAAYFSSGVDPGSNAFEWHKDQPVPTPVKFISKGAFSIGEEEWIRLLPDRAALLPKVLADRQFKLNGETIRFTLEHLPRAKNETPSSTGNFIWGGSVLVKVTFRGKSQVLMQAEQPDSGQFSLSVGVVNGKAGVKIDHQPHYNNSFTRYWIFDETETRFRQLQSEQSQGC